MPAIAIRLRARCADKDMDAAVRPPISKAMKLHLSKPPCTDSTVGFVYEAAKDRPPEATAANAEQMHF